MAPRNPYIDYDSAVGGLGYVSPLPFFLGLAGAVEYDARVEAPCPVCRYGRATMEKKTAIAECDRGCSHGQITKVAMLATPILPRRKRATNDNRSAAHRALLAMRRAAA